MKEFAHVDAADELLPPPKLFVLGLQHVLVMYAGAIAVPLIIGGALKMSKDDIAFLISADLFCCGLVTIIQCMGIGKKVGIRLPVMMGIAFTGIGPIIAIGSNPDLGMQAVFGAVIASGIFTYFAAPYMSCLVRWFPPVVTGSVVLMIGISLMRVGINWAAGGQPMIASPTGPIPNPMYGIPLHLALAGTVLLSVLLLTAFVKGFLTNIAVLLSIAFGFIIAIALGKVEFGGVMTAPWFSLISPFHFGFPTFDPLSIMMLSVVMIVMMIESTGLFLALGEIVGRTITRDTLARGLRADGVGNMVGGVFGTFCYTSYSQNIGLVQMTGVRSRWVCVAAGAILIVLGCLPKMAFLAASIPQYVLGGAAVVMFGMVAAAGIKILVRADFATNSKNLYIVAVSLVLGMIPLVGGERFFSQLPEFLAKFMQNGILLTSFTAVFLNILFNYRSTAAEVEGFAIEDKA